MIPTPRFEKPQVQQLQPLPTHPGDSFGISIRFALPLEQKTHNTTRCLLVGSKHLPFMRLKN